MLSACCWGQASPGNAIETLIKQILWWLFKSLLFPKHVLCILGIPVIIVISLSWMLRCLFADMWLMHTEIGQSQKDTDMPTERWEPWGNVHWHHVTRQNVSLYCAFSFNVITWKQGIQVVAIIQIQMLCILLLHNGQKHTKKINIYNIGFPSFSQCN